MKVARIVAAALAFASASTAAVEPFLPNASLEFESTEAGFSYRILQQTTFAVAYLPTGDVRVESTVERFNLSTQRGEKMRVAATGCLTQGGGYIGYLLADGSLNSQNLWSPEGRMVRDSIAVRVCIAFIRNIGLKQARANAVAAMKAGRQ